MFNEADTRAKLIDPKLHKSGWVEDKILREKAITPGKLLDEKGSRKPGKIPDYILVHNNIPVAVVEAKEEGKSALVGMQQAKRYSENLHVLFAYSTNGHQIEEFNFITNKQNTVDSFPSPDSLWNRYIDYTLKGIKIKVNPVETPYHYVAGGKKPWYFQEVAIKKAIESIVIRKKRVLLTMATGSGKTFVAFQLVWKLIKSGYLRRVLYIADRTFLRDQAYNEFSPFEDARDIIEEGQAPKTRDIYFSMYQSIYSGDDVKRLYQQYPPDFFDLVIIDECHRSGFGTWREILDYFGNAIHLGMTATPKRDDNIDTYGYFGEPVYSYSMGQAIEEGFLAPFQIYRTFTNIDRDGLHIRDAIFQGAQIYVPEEADLKEIYTLEDFEREIVLPDRTAKICDHLANLLRDFGPMQRTMVFCVNMEHAALVAKELQNQFSDLGHSDYAVRIVSEERNVKSIFERFADSDKSVPVVATTVDLLTTGVNVPSVQNIVLIKSIASKVVFHQIIGRGSRIDTITRKYFFRIVDYVNATRLFDEWDYPPKGELPNVPEGPYNLSISGLVVEYETQKPIGNARITAQIGPNMRRSSRVQSNGKFLLVNLPHSPVTLSVTSTGFKSKELTITPTPDIPPIVLELRPEEPVEKKIELKGIEVFIADQTRIVLTASGKNLTDAEYIEYSRDGIVKRAASLKDLREIWKDSEKRTKLLKKLREQSIYPNLLSSILKKPDADSFDVIAHIAFNVPVVTRKERADAFKNKNVEFIKRFDPKAQEVIIALLDKYRVGGVEEISKPEVFRLPPFDRMRYITGIAKLFGGFDKLKDAIDSIQRGLYTNFNHSFEGNGLQ